MTLFRSAALIACFFLSASIGRAAVTITGDVNPNPPQAGDFVTVGGQALGTFDIDGGSSLSLGNLQVGGQDIGLASVTGAGTTLSIDVALNVQGLLGHVAVADSAVVQIGDDLFIAVFGGRGEVSVDGERTIVQVGDEIFVGAEGPGSLGITNGAIVTAENYRGGSQADIRVDGEGSRFITPRSFNSESSFVRGRLAISNGGEVGFAQTFVLEDGRVGLSGGRFEANDLFNSGLIGGAGLVEANVFTNEATGRVEALAGDSLFFDSNRFSEARNSGEIVVDGGVIELTSKLVNEGGNGFPAGRVTLRDGLLRAEAGDFANQDILNGGLIAATGGVNDLHGIVTNSFNGQIALTNDSVLTFHDRVSNSGEISVMPGSRAVFLDGLDSGFQGTLLANIAGTDSNTGFGLAEVVGEASLNGLVSVALSGGFEPVLGDSFTLLTASGGVVGEPTLGEAPQLDQGLAFELITTETTLVINVIEELPGDANFDGLVNAADYAVIRDRGGPGFADSLTGFQTNFSGQQVSGAASAAAVPEPQAAVLLVLLGLSGISSRGQRRR